jgi:UDP-sugar transporter A1/2/3
VGPEACEHTRRYTPIVFIMILNHALSGIAVSLVMKFADNIVKVYSTSVAMVLTTLVSIPLFGFRLTLPFVLGTSVTSVAVFLHYQSKAK